MPLNLYALYIRARLIIKDVILLQQLQTRPYTIKGNIKSIDSLTPKQNTAEY